MRITRYNVGTADGGDLDGVRGDWRVEHGRIMR